MKTNKPYKHADRITDEDVEAFVTEIKEQLMDLAEAAGFALDRIIEIPDEHQDQKPALHAGDEILKMTLERATPALREAFRGAAEEVLGIGAGR